MEGQYQGGIELQRQQIGAVLSLFDARQNIKRKNQLSNHSVEMKSYN